MQLSTNFSLAELTFSSTATRNGIDNSPPAEIVSALTATAAGLELVRALVGHPLHVDSGYRCEALEKMLCAKDFRGWCERRGLSPNTDNWPAYFATKAHPQGYAADVVCDAMSPAEMVKLVVGSGIRFDQCIMEGDWMHISFAPEMRQVVLTATFGPNGPTYTEGVA